MKEGLEKIGIKVVEEIDRLIVTGGKMRHAIIDSKNDHRIAMAFSLLGAAAGGITIEDAECVSKTFPEYWDILRRLGGKIMSNSFGSIFRITSFGESHGSCVGVIIDGCPAGLPLEIEEIQIEVDKENRQPTQGKRRGRKKMTWSFFPVFFRDILLGLLYACWSGIRMLIPANTRK